MVVIGLRRPSEFYEFPSRLLYAFQHVAMRVLGSSCDLAFATRVTGHAVRLRKQLVSMQQSELRLGR